MRKTPLFVSILLLINVVFLVDSFADWELYDNFDSGSISLEKWSIKNNNSPDSSISIENYKAKFVHGSTHPANDSLYLFFDDDPGTITGMRATVTVESCTGDVRTRLTGYAGKVGSGHVWSAIQLHDIWDKIYTAAELEGPPPDYTIIDSLHYAEFKKPIDIENETYTVTIMFEADQIIYEVEGLGKITYKYVDDVDPITDFFRAIGTRSSNGDGPCTVYFDDVYVFRP